MAHPGGAAGQRQAHPQRAESAGEPLGPCGGHRATGTDCYVMKVVLASMDHLQTLLDKLVVWGSPVTSIVISSPVLGRGIQRGLGTTDDGG